MRTGIKVIAASAAAAVVGATATAAYLQRRARRSDSWAAGYFAGWEDGCTGRTSTT